MGRRRGTRQLAASTLASTLAVAVLTGCATSLQARGADKAGGSDAPLVLRLGDVDSEDHSNTTQMLEYLRRAGREALRRHVARPRHLRRRRSRAADVEAQVARKVRDGSFDLGWIGAAAWDELGVTSFQALHAPFLVTEDALLDRVATGPLAAQHAQRDSTARASAGWRSFRNHYAIRSAFGVRWSPSAASAKPGGRDPSRATDAALRALGATPVHRLGKARSGRDRRGQADGRLESLVGYFGPDVVTANVSIFPALHTLFANPASLRGLTDAERAALEQAAARTRAHAVAQRRSAQAAIDTVLLGRPGGLRHRRRSRRAREQSRARGSRACDATRLLRARARSPHEEPDQPDPSAEAISPSRSRPPRSPRLLRPPRVWAYRQHGASGDEQARRDLPVGADEG